MSITEKLVSILEPPHCFSCGSCQKRIMDARNGTYIIQLEIADDSGV